MKKFFCAGFLALALPCYSQLVLKPGDTWTWQFDTLVRTGSVPAFVTPPNGSLTLAINSSTFQNGDALRYEMFENNTSEMPICSGTLTPTSPSGVLCQTGNAWQDLQGVIRLTMLSGSVTVDSIAAVVVKSGPSLSSYDVYSATIMPVSLAAALSGGKMLISWPRVTTNSFSLQVATNLSAPIMWKNASNAVYSSATNYYTTNDLSGPSRFFRLQAAK